MPTHQARRYCFTLWINNGEEHDLWSDEDSIKAKFEAAAIFRYLYWQIELADGEPHQAHVQGYIELLDKQSIQRVQQCDFSPSWATMHLESSKGTAAENVKYCSKIENRLVGPFSVGSSGDRGGRPKLDEMARDLLQHRDLRRFANENPGSFVQHNRGLERLLEITTQPERAPEGTQLRPWQLDLSAKIIDVAPHERRVYWIFDETGDTGKSWFINWLVREHGSLPLSNGRHDRILNAWRGQSIVTFDFPRSVVDGGSDRVPYGPIERIKDGIVWSGFSGASAFVGRIPHVLCFANFLPDYSKLSADRWLGAVFEIRLGHPVELHPLM